MSSSSLSLSHFPAASFNILSAKFACIEIIFAAKSLERRFLKVLRNKMIELLMQRVFILLYFYSIPSNGIGQNAPNCPDPEDEEPMEDGGKIIRKQLVILEEANCLMEVWEKLIISSIGDWNSNFSAYKNATISGSHSQSDYSR
jgi:hypothetical protein